MLHKGEDSRDPSSFLIVLVRGIIASLSGHFTSHTMGNKFEFDSCITVLSSLSLETNL